MSGRDVRGANGEDAAPAEGAERAGRDGWLIAALALLVRLGVVLWASSRIPPTADGDFYHEVAQRIAAGQGYTWLWPDGAVTYAAHYPVGYPALMGLPYAIFGPEPVGAMVMNAIIGALACVAVHALLRRRGRRAAALGALLVALHPALVAYTPALMTEGVAAALWVCAVWAAQAAREGRGRRRWGLLVLCGVVVGVATLVRPQSILLAPLLGVLTGTTWRARGVAGALVTAVAVLCCAPWTARNCQRMGTCAFVSVNGGWNLLIGTQPEGNGAWSELRVPDACKTVYDEAEKDACFGRAARERIRVMPRRWLLMMPQKLHVTFDYCGAGPWYLHQANAQAFSHEAKVVLGTVETVFSRLVLLLALAGAWASRAGRRQRIARTVVFGLGLAFVAQRHATLAYAALAALILWRPSRTVLDVSAVGALVLVGGVHAVFFGAGRYQLVIWPILCGVAAWHFPRLVEMARELRSRGVTSALRGTTPPPR